MKTDSKALLKEFADITLANMAAANGFLSLSDQRLNFKRSPDSWSILECLEHLNRYSDFYLPEISRHTSTTSTPTETFKSGLWGGYLIKMVIPGQGSRKMKTFRTMNPTGSALDKSVIHTFIETQNELLGLISKAEACNLNLAGVVVTFTKVIKLKTGDALRFMAYHNQRHVMQAQRIQATYE